MRTRPKILEVIVNEQGEATVQTRGFTGASCREASRFLEQALGHTTGEQLTAEFHQPATIQPQHVKQQS